MLNFVMNFRVFFLQFNFFSNYVKYLHDIKVKASKPGVIICLTSILIPFTLFLSSTLGNPFSTFLDRRRFMYTHYQRPGFLNLDIIDVETG